MMMMMMMMMLTGEDGGWDRAAEALVDFGEEVRKGNGIIAG